MNITQEADRYIDCNLQNYKKRIEKFNPHRIEIISNYGDKTFYLEDYDEYIFGKKISHKKGDIYEKYKSTMSFLNYDYAAARKWDLENAGVELSQSY